MDYMDQTKSVFGNCLLIPISMIRGDLVSFFSYAGRAIISCSRKYLTRIILNLTKVGSVCISFLT